MRVKKLYLVNVTREGKWWMVEAPDVDGLTQARRFADVEQAARELIAVTLDVPLSKINVAMVLDVAGKKDLDAELATVKQERTEAARLAADAAAHLVALARSLVAADVPVRDIGAMLEISPQRVSQLVS